MTDAEQRGAGLGPAPVESSDVFISYSRSDRDAALRIADGLRARGRTLWVDWEGIAPTAEWMSEIRSGIDHAQGVLFLLSPQSATSRVCAEEVAHAAKAGKRIVPVVVSDTESAQLPEEIRRRQWVFARPSDDLAAALDQIEEGLDLDLDSVRTHTRLLVRSAEWRDAAEDSGRLLRGAELDNAERWLASSPSDPAPTPEQRRYVQASRAGASRRQRRLAASVSLALVASLLLAGTALVQRSDAREQRDAATTQALASQSLADLDSDPAKALTEAVAAADSGRTPEVEQALRAALLASHLDRTINVNGHPGRPGAIAFSRDGTVVYTSTSAANEVDLLTSHLVGFEVATGRQVLDTKLDGYVSSVHALPDGTRLAVSGPGLALTFVDTSTGKATVAPIYATSSGQAVTPEQESSVRSPSQTEAAVSHDGTFLVTIPFNFGTSDVIDARDGSFLRALAEPRDLPPGPRIVPVSVDISPDDQLVALAYSDGVVRLFRPSTGAPAGEITVGSAVTVARWSPSGHLLLTASEDRLLRIWDTTSHQVVQTIGQSALLTDAAWLGTDEYVLTGDGAARARIWSVRRGDDVTDLIGHAQEVTYVATSPDGRTVATTSPDGTLRLWRAGTGVATAQQIAAQTVNGVAVTPDGSTVVSASLGAGTIAWRTDGQGTTRVLDPGAGGPPAISPDGGHLVTLTLSASPAVRLLDLATGNQIWRTTDLGSIPSDVAGPDGQYSIVDRTVLPFSAAFSPDGTRIAVATQTGAVVLDAATGRKVAAVTAQPLTTDPSQYALLAQVRGIAYAPDGSFIALPSGESVLIADPTTGRRLRTLHSSSGVVSVAVTPGSDRVLATYADGFVREWSLAQQRVVMTLPNVSSALGVDVAHNGLIASTGRDGFLRIWSPTGTEIQRTRVATLIAVAVRWAPDGQHTIVGTGEGIDDTVRNSESSKAHQSGTAQVIACEVCRDYPDLVDLARSRSAAAPSSAVPNATPTATPVATSPAAGVSAAPTGSVPEGAAAIYTATLHQSGWPAKLEWLPDGSFWYWIANGTVGQGSASFQGTTAILTDDQCGDLVGRYTWASDGGLPRLHALEDACVQRSEVLNDTVWTRAG